MTLHRATLITLLWLAASLPALAQERILSFNSDIQVDADAGMVVTETIRVRAEGNFIRRGIFRDFPTRYTDRLGNAYRVGFEMLEARRDGVVETWRTEKLSNGVRIYLGNANVFLSPGEYTYTIRYQTNRQVGFFADHDELYWNVTGNGWDFVIEQAGARVTLPEAVPSANLVMEGYTGVFGASGRAYRASVFDGGGSIESTAALRSREGLTLVLSWPKGVVQEPTATQKLSYLLKDNLGLLLALATFTGVVVYLYSAWSKVGRDPDKGVIFPHYEPPEGFSPASLRYISRMGYDTRALTAAVVNLAVKGYLLIDKTGNDYIITRQTSDAPLAPGERAVLTHLLTGGNTVVLDQENRNKILKATKSQRSALRRDYLDKYFFRNRAYLWLPALATLAMVIITLVTGNMVPVAAVIFGLLVILHFVFAWLLRAPSIEGRRLMDKVEGFKMYLEVAEKDEMNLRNPPQKTPELFEKYLPYAIALGVEQAWGDKFASVFARLEAETGTHYHPVWYAGTFNTNRFDSFSKDIGKGFATAISAASSPPASASGSGGGGFSGGGGGGGGGGGW